MFNTIKYAVEKTFEELNQMRYVSDHDILIEPSLNFN